MAVDRPTPDTPTTVDPLLPATTPGDGQPIIIPDQAAGDLLLQPFEMEEHPQGGFHGLLEVIPTKADYLLDLIRANSLWPLLSGLSCCAIEMMSTATSVNDIDRFGMFPFRASPRQADVLIVAGTLTTKMAGPLVRLWEQMPEPKWCVAMGTCTTSGGRFKRSYSRRAGGRPRHAGRRLRARLPATAGGAHLRDDEAPRAREAAPRPVEYLRRPWAAAHALGRRRALTTPVAAGALVRLLTERLAADLRDLWTDADTVEFTIDGARAVDVLRTLRDDPDLAFFMLADAAAVDYGPGERFEVVYHLFSWKHPAWLRVRAHVDRANPRIPSITGLWEGAMFHEREMYDMMGIAFEGNRDLRRIYMSPDYRSFPQRKDFILPDDAADSPAAGVNPLERPETWDLTRFREAATPRVPALDVRDDAPAAALEDERDARRPEPPTMTTIDRDTKIPDPIELDRAEEERLRLVAGLTPVRTAQGEYAGFDQVGIPGPPAADRARAGDLQPRRRRDAGEHGPAAPLHARRHAAGGEGPRRGHHRHRPGARLPASRDREAVRERDLHDGAHVRRPDGLHLDDAQRARPGHRVREAVRDRGAEARRVHPRARGRAEPRLQPRPDDGVPGARHGWADADPVRVHQSRRDRRHALRHQRTADALQLLPGRRRELRHERRVPRRGSARGAAT